MPRNRSLAIAVFARTPRPGRAKTRLVPLLGAGGAAELQAALILDTTRKVNRLGRSVARWFFLAGGEFPEFLGGRHWTLAKQRGRDLGERLDHAFRRMLCHHRAAVVIGTDSPSLAPRPLRQALAELGVCDAVLGPCPDGGFYLIGLGRTAPRLFRGVRWSTGMAFRDMLRNLLRNGLSCSLLATLPDVDRRKDVFDLARRMARSPAMRASAPALWRWLKQTEKSWMQAASRRYNAPNESLAQVNISGVIHLSPDSLRRSLYGKTAPHQSTEVPQDDD